MSSTASSSAAAARRSYTRSPLSAISRRSIHTSTPVSLSAAVATGHAAARGAIDTPTLTTALTYVSRRLLQKTKEHHTFIVTGDVLFSLFFRNKAATRAVELVHTAALTDKHKEVLVAAVLRAADKYGIERVDWVNNAGEVEMRDLGIRREDMEELVVRSLAQKEIMFSGDGMTLLAADFRYELRLMLHKLSRELEGGEGRVSRCRSGEAGEDVGEGVGMEDMVELVRRLVAVEGKGRSLRRAEIEGRYGALVFSDSAWMALGREYEKHFGEKGLMDEVGEPLGEDGE